MVDTIAHLCYSVCIVRNVQTEGSMYNMFTQDGNRKVAAIVSAAQALAKFEDVERVWNWTEIQLHDLSQRSEYEEAMDTAVREAVYDAIV